ncbi:hypothetical protein predicted by Glimmer/Critica [Sorangium cellulosum So ce56]|uniref:Uncharacterized protein n=1 Tax=Sorangium cellulosum (strain So ce56) TaxID=448385 RepID=A9GGZ4_SORC5|nr:hypothetical protein predicted by Glimmer/Critica [Sorangium cellulosum So ce56]
MRQGHQPRRASPADADHLVDALPDQAAIPRAVQLAEQGTRASGRYGNPWTRTSDQRFEDGGAIRRASGLLAAGSSERADLTSVVLSQRQPAAGLTLRTPGSYDAWPLKFQEGHQ